MMNNQLLVKGTEEAIRFFKELPAKTDATVKEAIEELGTIGARRIRKIIREKANDSGRLLASVNKKEDWKASDIDWDRVDYWKIANRGIDPPSPNDCYYEVIKEGNTWRVIIGTNVPYAAHIEEGFDMDGPRVVFILGVGFRTVESFSFEGIHAFAAGLESMNPLLNLIIGKHMRKAGWKSEGVDYRFQYLGSSFVDSEDDEE